MADSLFNGKLHTALSRITGRMLQEVELGMISMGQLLMIRTMHWLNFGKGKLGKYK